MPHFLGSIAGTEKAGMCGLFYGDTNSGKTHSSLTAPKRVLHINKEPKDPRLVHSVVRPDAGKDIDYVEFSDFDDEQNYLNQLIEQYKRGERPYETIFNDGLTFAMINTKSALEAFRLDRKEEAAKEDKSKIAPTLLDYSSVEQKDWGTLASLTARTTKLLHQLSKFGLLVVTTAIATEYPKWNNTVKVGPSLLGKEFPKMIHGYFDTIGYIVQPFFIDAGGPHTPRVSFVSHSNGFTNSYMVRANPRLIEAEQKYGPVVLDLTIISKIARGEFTF